MWGTVTDIAKIMSDCPVLIQGALGSALFWVTLQIVLFAWKFVGRILGRLGQSYQKNTLLREYIYRKFTSRNGLVKLTQGYAITFDHVVRDLIYGLIFFCLALLFGGLSQISLVPQIVIVSPP